ncbi:hypothetical protein ACPT8J_07335 [Lactiplantibacillus plantarum]
MDTQKFLKKIIKRNNKMINKNEREFNQMKKQNKNFDNEFDQIDKMIQERINNKEQ